MPSTHEIPFATIEQVICCPMCGSDRLLWTLLGKLEDNAPYKVKCSDCGFTHCASRFMLMAKWKVNVKPH